MSNTLWCNIYQTRMATVFWRSFRRGECTNNSPFLKNNITDVLLKCCFETVLKYSGMWIINLYLESGQTLFECKPMDIHNCPNNDHLWGLITDYEPARRAGVVLSLAALLFNYSFNHIIVDHFPTSIESDHTTVLNHACSVEDVCQS